jgi:hypothetical protein
MVCVWRFVHHLDATEQLQCRPQIIRTGYLLPSLETFHSTTTEKIIRLFMDVAIHEVAWYVIKQKKGDAMKQLYYPA